MPPPSADRLLFTPPDSDKEKAEVHQDSPAKVPSISTTLSSRKPQFTSYASKAEAEAEEDRDDRFMDHDSDEADISMGLDSAKLEDDVFTHKSSDSFHPSLGFTPSVHRFDRSKYQSTAASPSLRLQPKSRVHSPLPSIPSVKNSSHTPPIAGLEESFDVSAAEHSSNRRKRSSTLISGLDVSWDQMDAVAPVNAGQIFSDQNENVKMHYVQIRRELRKRDHELAITAAVANKATGMHKNLLRQLPATVKERMPTLVHLSRTPSRTSLTDEGTAEPPPQQPGLRPFLTRSTLSNEWLINSTNTRRDSSPDIGYQDDADTQDEFETADDKSSRVDRHRVKSACPPTPQDKFAAAKQAAVEERLFLLEMALAESRKNEVAQRRLAASYKTQADNLQRIVEQKQALRAHFANLSAYTRQGTGGAPRLYTGPSPPLMRPRGIYSTSPTSPLTDSFGPVGSRPNVSQETDSASRLKRSPYSHGQLSMGPEDPETPIHTTVMAIRQYSPSPRSSLLSSVKKPISICDVPSPNIQPVGLSPIRRYLVANGHSEADINNSVQAIEDNFLNAYPLRQARQEVPVTLDCLASDQGSGLPQEDAVSDSKKIHWADRSRKMQVETPTKPKTTSRDVTRSNSAESDLGTMCTRRHTRTPPRTEPSTNTVTRTRGSQETSAEPTTIPAKVVHDAFCVFLLFVDYTEFFFIIACRILIAIRYGASYSSRVDKRPRPKRYYL